MVGICEYVVHTGQWAKNWDIGCSMSRRMRMSSFLSTRCLLGPCRRIGHKYHCDPETSSVAKYDRMMWMSRCHPFWNGVDLCWWHRVELITCQFVISWRHSKKVGSLICYKNCNILLTTRVRWKSSHHHVHNATGALHKVDGHTLSSKSTTAADAVDVQFTVVRQVVANDQRHLDAPKDLKNMG